MQASFHAYTSLWNARADLLASRQPHPGQHVRTCAPAFGTGDQATIRDTAGELWSQDFRCRTRIFLVTEPSGQVLASLGGIARCRRCERISTWCSSRATHFPDQASGFLLQERRAVPHLGDAGLCAIPRASRRC